MEKQTIIDQFNKNSIEVVKIHIQEWKAQMYVSLRVFALQNPAEPGSEIATKKGVCINAELLPKLIQALQKAQEALDEAENCPESEQKRRSTQE